MSEDEHTQPPTTVKEIGIHLGYMNESIVELKQLMKDMSAKAVSPESFDNLKTRVTKLEADVGGLDGFIDSIKGRIAGYAVGILVAMLLALYGLDKFIM